MRKLVLKQKDRPLDPFLGKACTAEYIAVMRELDQLTEPGIRAMWSDTFRKRPSPHAQVWLLRMGIEYHALRKGYIRVQGDCSPKIERRYQLAKSLNMAGLRKESDFLSDQYETGGDDMKKVKADKRTGKDRREQRVTASSVLIRILGLAKVPQDEAIIAQVKDETGSTKFDAAQLAWYKWKYRQGALKGQDGKLQTIEQGEAKKPAKSKKKLVIKKKAA